MVVVEPASPVPVEDPAKVAEPRPENAPPEADADPQPEAAADAQPKAESPDPGADSEPEEPSQPVRLGKREGRSPRDMALSLAVLIVPIALLMLFYHFMLDGDAPASIDPSATIQEAQQAGAFTVAAPTGLSDGWHAGSATWVKQANGSTLRIGYTDPDRDPVQLVESSVPADTLLKAELTSKAQPLMTSYRTENGVWRLYSARSGETALVLSDTGRTIIVIGKADVSSLEKLASSLG